MRCPPGTRLPGWTHAHRPALLHELSLAAVRQIRGGRALARAGLKPRFTRVSFHNRPAGTNRIDPAQKAAAIRTTNVRHTADSRFSAKSVGTQWSTAANPYSNTCPPIAASAHGRGSQKPHTAMSSSAYGSSRRPSLYEKKWKPTGVETFSSRG